MTVWVMWNWLGLTRNARTAHILGKALRKALTDDEYRELTAYNADRARCVFVEQYRTRMRALQDRYNASVEEAARLTGGIVVRVSRPG